jgi:hypothetical protein
MRGKMLTNEQIEKAIKLCYYPIRDPDVQVLAWLIEELVLPKGVNGYTEEELLDYIKEKLA